jgi:hypothetical protein
MSELGCMCTRTRRGEITHDVVRLFGDERVTWNAVFVGGTRAVRQIEVVSVRAWRCQRPEPVPMPDVTTHTAWDESPLPSCDAMRRKTLCLGQKAISDETGGECSSPKGGYRALRIRRLRLARPAPVCTRANSTKNSGGIGGWVHSATPADERSGSRCRGTTSCQ